MTERQYAVAIDGPSGAGKSTLARAAAEALHILYVDTGAIYRTIGVYMYRHDIAPTDAPAVIAALPEITVALRYDEEGLQRMYLNGEDVTKEIRLPMISKYASDVSAIPEVRAFLMELQRSLAREHSVIMDGRDIGTVVLPDAEVKVFLCADVETRARRRFWSWSSGARRSPLTRCCGIWSSGIITIPTGRRRRCGRRTTPS